MELNIQIKFSSHTVDRILQYPHENIIKIHFENVNEKVTVEKITLNGIDTNIYHNTSFAFDNSDVVLNSAHTIDSAGTYILNIDDYYIETARSKNWHVSKNKKNFIFTHEHTNSSFVDVYRDREHIGFAFPFIPCFGCSYTYGAYQPADTTWPHLLRQKTGENFINLGVGGSSIDGIYNNLKLLYEQHKFEKCFILFPTFERRIVRANIGDLWINIFSTVFVEEASKHTFSFLSDPRVTKKSNFVKQQIIEDIDNKYSKKVLKKIVEFCSKNNIKLCASSWTDDVYETLKTFDNVELLPKFPPLEIHSERADDGVHPHKKHFQTFVDQIELD